jgi:hypothetical protein
MTLRLPHGYSFRNLPGTWLTTLLLLVVREVVRVLVDLVTVGAVGAVAF